MPRRFVGAVPLVMALLLLLASCGLPFTGAPSPTPRPGRSADPVALAAREAVNPNPDFDFGQTVQITPGGFHPAVLVSVCCQPITWKNLTGAPVTVVINRLMVNSGPIPSGATFVYTPANMQSMTYYADGHPEMHGAIQVNQTFESFNIPARPGAGRIEGLFTDS